MTFLEIFDFFYFLKRRSSEDVRMLLAWLVSSTSPSGGNQVDGLPPASSTETVSNSARVEPRTPVVLTMRILFLMRKPSTSVRRSDIIILSYVLRLWIELIK